MSTNVAIASQLFCSHGLLQCAECKAQHEALLGAAREVIELWDADKIGIGPVASYPDDIGLTISELRQAIDACEKA